MKPPEAPSCLYWITYCVKSPFTCFAGGLSHLTSRLWNSNTELSTFSPDMLGEGIWEVKYKHFKIKWDQIQVSCNNNSCDIFIHKKLCNHQIISRNEKNTSELVILQRFGLLMLHYCTTFSQHQLFAFWKKNWEKLVMRKSQKIKWLGLDKFSKIAKIKCCEISLFQNPKLSCCQKFHTITVFQNENAWNENSGLLGILSVERMSNPKTVSFVGRVGLGTN